MSKELTKEEIEQVAIKYSDKVNMEGETSWSLADAFIAGFEYSDQNTKPLIDIIEHYKETDAEYEKQNKELIDEIAELRKHIEDYKELSNLKELRIQELQSDLKTAESVNEWISVEDRLPLARQKTLAINQFGFMRSADWEMYTGSDEKWFKETFTHWMIPPNRPLPTNPI